jgi:GNAT superfamily N-acetyltransferase
MWDDDAGARAALVQSPLGFRAVVACAAADGAGGWAAQVAGSDADLPGIIADAATAAAFAGEWATARGVPARPVDAQRLYGHVDVAVAVPRSSGQLRLAGERDVEALALMWADADAEAGAVRPAGHDYQAEVLEHVRAGRAWLWWLEGGIVSMCYAAAPAWEVVRLRGLYTLSEHRGRGFGTNLVAGVSDQLGADGHEVVLYTQLANPLSNRIYQRIGYRPVSEVLTYDFG